jgi:hypothetical protein
LFMSESNPADTGPAGSLILMVKADRFACFFPLLQKGFVLEVITGCPIRALLRDQLGLTEEYIETRIQTVFLDGKPVDDIDGAVVPDGSTLAISSALPGLLGATLRRGGYYAALRSGITHEGVATPAPAGAGYIVVKLFNLTVAELGPLFLERGIGIEAGELARFLRELPEDCRAALDGLTGMSGRVCLQVKALDPEC